MLNYSYTVGRKESEFDSNRIREHLVAFLAYHDPDRLRTTIKVDKMVKFAEENGLDKLNLKLEHRFNDQVDTSSKLGTPKERILRLCKGFTPELTNDLMNKAKVTPTLTSQEQFKCSKEDTELLNQIYCFYLQHNPEKLQHLAQFFDFAKTKGRTKLNKVLLASYGHELPQPTNNFFKQKINEDAEKIMVSSRNIRKNVSKDDQKTRNQVRDFFQDVDPSKLKAAEMMVQWINVMGETRANSVFQRLYGRSLTESAIKKSKSRFGRKSGISIFSTGEESKARASKNIRFKNKLDTVPPKLAREQKKKKMQRSMQFSQKPNPHVRSSSHVDPFLDLRRDSYLNSPALFMRNIPNVGLSKDPFADSKRFPMDELDVDDDSSEARKEIASLNQSFDIIEAMKKSPLGLLKQEDRDDSSFSSFVSAPKAKKNNFATKFMNKMNPLKPNKKMEPKKLAAGVVKNMQRVEEHDTPRNASFESHQPLRPHFDSIVPSPKDSKNVQTVNKARENLLNDANFMDNFTSARLKSFNEHQNEPLPIKSVKIPLVGAKSTNSMNSGRSETVESVTINNSVTMNNSSRKVSDASNNPGGGRKLVRMVTNLVKRGGGGKVSNACEFVLCNDIGRPNYGKCVKCGLKKNLHIGEELDLDAEENICRQFVGKGLHCDQCNRKQMDHQWYAFDVPKGLLGSRAKADTPDLEESDI